MVGLRLLKHTIKLPYEEAAAVWLENPYLQYICGEQYFCHDFPIDPSQVTRFRKSSGQAGCEFILGLTVTAGLATRTIAKTSLAAVNVDTTVQDKAVALPIDASLLHKVRNVGEACQKGSIGLRQNYERVG
jgi:IS5 family transposase